MPATASAIIIRPAIASDEPRCLALLALLRGEESGPASSEVFRTLLAGERGLVLVAEEKATGAVLGSASMTFNLALRYGGEYCQLEELIVDPAARGLKLGGLLMQAVIDAARSRGCAELGLYLVEWSKGNQPFYEKYGLRIVGSEMRISLE
jgi:GNAT superfamily N-acetyltransferase